MDLRTTYISQLAGNQFACSFSFSIEKLARKARVANRLSTLGYDVTTFEFPSQKQERKGGREPSFKTQFWGTY